MYTKCLALLVLSLIPSRLAQDLAPTADIKTLSELPLDKLLHVKNSLSLSDIEADLTEGNTTVSLPENREGNPSALPLKTTKSKDVKRVDYEEDSKDKGSIQSIFQVSVTALAFLAFGGYLVCLVTQAINNQSTGQQVIVMDSLRKPIRYNRPARYRRPSTRRPTVHRLKREVTPRELDFEKLYEALVSISEGYTNAQTMDYKNYNRSVSRG